jgi:hypothetical protein
VVKARLLPCLAAALVFVSLCPAQQNPRFRVLVSFSSSLPEINAFEYADALSSSLSSSQFVDVVYLSVAGEDPAREAGRLGYDVALAVTLAPSQKAVRLAWSLLSANTGAELGSGSVITDIPDARRLQSLFWMDLIASVEAALINVDPPRAVRLFVAGPPGAKIDGIGDTSLVIPEEGVIEVAVDTPLTYSWSASAEGYDDAHGVLALIDQRPTLLAVDMRPQRPWTVDLGLYNGSFLDTWTSYRFMNDRFFIRAGCRQYLVGLSLRDEKPDYKPALFSSQPLIQLGIGGGGLLGRPGQGARTYWGALVTARIVLPAGGCIFFDPIAPLSLEPFGGLEWRPNPRFGFFGELYATLFLFADTFMYAATVRDNDGPSALNVYGEGWVLNLPSFRFGARFYL